MARLSWLDDTSSPALDKHVENLEHFTAAMADGVIASDELAEQEQRLVAAMKAVEGDLSDAQHAKVTSLLLELSAYNIMQVLHEMAGERLRKAFR